MLNQAVVEALYSATYIENYLDCVENLPNDLQRHVSRLRELDATCQSNFDRIIISKLIRLFDYNNQSDDALILTQVFEKNVFTYLNYFASVFQTCLYEYFLYKKKNKDIILHFTCVNIADFFMSISQNNYVLCLK